MALVNIDSALKDALRIIKTSPINGGVEIMSYKRNRTIALIKTSDKTIILRVRGYSNQEDTITLEYLSKKLKTAMKREFPRSRKVRLVKFHTVDILDRVHQKI